MNVTYWYFSNLGGRITNVNWKDMSLKQTKMFGLWFWWWPITLLCGNKPAKTTNLLGNYSVFTIGIKTFRCTSLVPPPPTYKKQPFQFQVWCVSYKGDVLSRLLTSKTRHKFEIGERFLIMQESCYSSDQLRSTVWTDNYTAKQRGLYNINVLLSFSKS